MAQNMNNNTELPLVSIITPCFNAESTISQTIESVLAQTYRNWEMLIIDDGSTDGSIELIKEYKSQDNRIKLLKTQYPSGSPSKPRNIGIDYAKGTYVAFLDSDDLWMPEKLEKQVAHLKKYNLALSYSYYEKMDWQGKRDNRQIKTCSHSTYNSLLKSNAIPCLTSIVSRDSIGNTRFKNIPQEDFCFWLDILKKGYQASNLCEVTALYREAKNSRSANKFKMFKGYWNVIYNHQHIPFVKCCYYMITYTLKGFAKYLK